MTDQPSRRVLMAMPIAAAILVLGAAASAADPQVPSAPADPVDYQQLTTLMVPEEAVTDDVDLTPVRIATLGKFTKLSASSTIKITWHTSVGVIHLLGNGYCQFVTHVDNIVGQGSTVLQSSGVQTFSTATSVDIFAGLGTGKHTVTIFVSGDADTCQANVGNFPNQLAIVEEITYG